jgi:hypothetical protein
VRIIQGWRDPAYQDQLNSSGISTLKGSSESLHCCTGKTANPRAKLSTSASLKQTALIVTDGNDPRYALAGDAAKGLGLVWGGDLVHTAPDPDHIQLNSAARTSSP